MGHYPPGPNRYQDLPGIGADPSSGSTSPTSFRGKPRSTTLSGIGAATTAGAATRMECVKGSPSGGYSRKAGRFQEQQGSGTHQLHRVETKASDLARFAVVDRRIGIAGRMIEAPRPEALCKLPSPPPWQGFRVSSRRVLPSPG